MRILLELVKLLVYGWNGNSTIVAMEQDLLFAWLSPIESNVDRKLHAHLSPARAKSPSPNSPLLRAKSAIRRTFSAGHRSQDHRERGR